MNSERNNPFDFLRTLAMLGVILFHAAAAYSTLTPHWSVHDTPSLIGDALRELLDVFIMPFFLFISGYFVLPSLKKNTLVTFVFQKFKRLYVYWIFIVLFFLPFMWWKQLHLSGNYLGYWLNNFLNIKNVYIGALPNASFSHTHFWFVSLLFYILVIFGIFYKLRGKFFQGHDNPETKPDKKISLLNLLIVGKFADVSYEIYLVHLYAIVGMQQVFNHFAIIPAAVKICSVFLLGTFISYFVAKFAIYKFPKISAAVMFVLFFVLMVIFNR